VHWYVVTIGQTPAFVAPMMVMLLVVNKRARLGRVKPLHLTTEVSHGNYLDCSRSVVFVGWWRLGIFPLERIASGGPSPTIKTKI
jgi:hypothetical protein